MRQPGIDPMNRPRLVRVDPANAILGHSNDGLGPCFLVDGTDGDVRGRVVCQRSRPVGVNGLLVRIGRT